MGTLLGEKREGNGSIRASDGGIPVVEQEFHYLVEANNKFETRESILSTPGLPLVGISQIGLALCQTKQAARREEGGLLWDVTCGFSSEVDEQQDDGDGGTDPEAWVPIYRTQFERETYVATQDRNGDPIVNPAGDPYSTGITLIRKIPVWNIWQFEAASVTDDDILDRSEVVNSVVFKNKQPHTLLCTVLDSVIGFYYGQRRRLTNYQLKYKKDNWKEKRLARGPNYLKTADDQASKTLYTVEGDSKTPTVGLLAENGTKTDKASPFYQEFEIYEPVAFSFLRV